MPSARTTLKLRSRRLWGVGLGLSVMVAVAACGGKVDEPESPTGALVGRSGARLRLVTWQSEDGFRLAKTELFDLQRSEHCSPRAVGGGYLCVPVSTARAKTAFVDPKCVQPLALVVGGALPPRYLLDDEAWRGAKRAEQCTKSTPKLYGVSSRASQTTYFSLRNGTCVRTVLDANESLYSVSEASLEDLAELRLEEEVSPERLHRRSWVSDDGLRLPATPIDSSIGVDCLLAEGTPNDWICQLNDRVSSEVRYTDAACTSSFVASNAPCGHPTVVPLVTSDCSVSYRKVGPEVPGTFPGYAMRSSVCKAVESSTESPRVFAMGEAVEPVRLERRSTTGGTSRLRTRELVDSSGRAFFDPTRQVTDSVGEFDCYLLEWAGLGAGCLPRGTTVSHTYFDDDACTVSAKVVSGLGSSCAKPLPKTVYDLPTPGSLSPRPIVTSYALGARRSRPLYLKSADGRCLDAGPRHMGETYDVGPVVNVSAVAFVKEVVDP